LRLRPILSASTTDCSPRHAAAPIAERKAKLLHKVTRVAERAWSTVEDKLDTANLAQATICAGIATEKMILLGGDPVQVINVSLSAPNILSELQALAEEIKQACAQLPDTPTFEAEVVSSPPIAGNAAANGSADARALE
jgi:hypothetical protein